MVAHIFALLFASSVVGETFEIGQRVFIKPDVEVIIDGRLVSLDDLAAIQPDPATVGKVLNGTLWLGGLWVRESDVMSIEAARQFYTAEIKRNPESASAYVRRGQVRIEERNLDLAVNDFNEAVRLDPKFATAYIGRGRVWELRLDHQRAIDDYTESIRLVPTANAHSNRGNAWAAIGAYENALNDHNESVRLGPTVAIPYNNLAWLLSTCPDGRFRDGERALTMAKKSFELDNADDPNKFDTIAAAYAESGDFDAAVEWQEKACALAEGGLKESLHSRLNLYKAGKPFRSAK
ncbi:MAG: hypothetical protein C0485_05535 [Pirellula sp.]|nr:hypothetical protein [Pirellula sp.]